MDEKKNKYWIKWLIAVVSIAWGHKDEQELVFYFGVIWTEGVV
jgi:hypothetical protein